MNKQEFLQEFEKLKKSYPKPPNSENGNNNCEYGDSIFNSSNTYYGFNSVDLHDCLYVYDGCKENTDVDCVFNFTTERCLECSDVAESTDCHFCTVMARSYNMDYCYASADCHDCFGCVNLHNKSFCVFNVQHTEEEYKAKLPGLRKMPKDEIYKKQKELIKKFPLLHSDYHESNNSEFCDYSYFNNNCYYCFDTANNKDCYYLITSYYSSDVFDSVYAIRCEQSAEANGCYDCYNCYFTEDCNRCYDSMYLFRCSDCNDCIGCIELAHKKYCILNVQYTKAEYEKKKAELKKELGLYFK